MRRITLLLAMALASCDRAQVASTPMELEHNLLALSRVEVFAPEGAARERAALLVAELSERGDFEACLGEPVAGSFEDTHAARLIFGTLADAEILRLAEPLAIETVEGERGFKIFGEWFRSPNDALVFTREDPDRPGLPVTVYAAGDPSTLQNWMQDFEPCSRPGVRVFAGGEPAFSARCSLSGSAWLGTLFDARALRREAARPGTARAIPVAGGIASLLVPPTFKGDERLAEYTVRLEAALARIDEMLPTERRRRPPLRIFVFDQAAAFEAAGGVASRNPRSAEAPEGGMPGSFGGGLALTRSNPIGRSVDVLLAPGLPDDSGAAAAALRAYDRSGPVAASWIRDGLGLHAAGRWWGRPLDEWVRHLLPEDLAGDAGAIEALLEEALSVNADRSLSAHVALPLRAIVFERVAELWSKDREGATDWNGLWTSGAERSLMSRAVFDVALRLADRLEIERESAAGQAGKDAELTSRSASLGIGWAFAESGAPLASRGAARAFHEAAEAGASHVELQSTFAVEASRPRFARVRGSYDFAPLEGDLGIAGGANAARRNELSVRLAPDLYLTPSGARFTERVRVKRGPEAGEVWTRTFQTYARFIQHYALLAELSGARELLLGTSTIDFSQSTGDVSSWDDPQFESWLRDGWTSVIAHARTAFDGRVGYRANWPVEAHRIEFWDQLDFCALGVDTGFQHPASPYRRPHDGLISGKYERWLEAMRVFADEHDLPLSVMAYLPASSAAWTDPRTAVGDEVDVFEQERLASGLVWALRGLLEKGQAPESIFFYGARSDPHAGGGSDRGFTVQNKPALDVLRGLAELSASENASGD